MTAAPPNRLFHGWIVVAGAFGVLFVGFGVAYSFAAFFHPLRDEFDATRGDISLVFAITGFLYFVLGAVSGPWGDRRGPRVPVLGGVLLVAAGLLLASAAQELWQVYLTYSLCVGVGVGFSYVPVVGAVQKWFVKKRGLASGLAVAGIGAGTLVVPLLAAGAIELWGWRETYFALALLTLAVGVPAALMVDGSPERRGLIPDGETTVTGFAPAAPWGYSVRDAIRTRVFRLLYFASVATTLGIFIPFAHLAPYARDEGFSDGFGAFLVGLIGIGSTVGRLFLGGWADRFGRRRSLMATFATMAASMLFWLVAKDAWSLAAFAIVFGMAYGGFVALIPALTADYFGSRNTGGILGILYTAAGFGALAGPVLAGAIYDARESYALPILVAVATNLVAIVTLALIPEPARWREAVPHAPTRTSTSESPGE